MKALSVSRTYPLAVVPIGPDVAPNFLSSLSETPSFSFAQMGGLGSAGRGLRGTLRIAQRQALLRGEGLGELGWGLPAEAGVGPFGVVVLALGG